MSHPTDYPYQELADHITVAHGDEPNPDYLVYNLPPSHVQLKAAQSMNIQKQTKDNKPDQQNTAPSGSGHKCKCEKSIGIQGGSSLVTTPIERQAANLATVAVTPQPVHGNTENHVLFSAIVNHNQNLAVEPWIRYQTDATDEPPIGVVPVVN